MMMETYLLFAQPSRRGTWLWKWKWGIEITNTKTKNPKIHYYKTILIKRGFGKCSNLYWYCESIMWQCVRGDVRIGTEELAFRQCLWWHEGYIILTTLEAGGSDWYFRIEMKQCLRGHGWYAISSSNWGGSDWHQIENMAMPEGMWDTWKHCLLRRQHQHGNDSTLTLKRLNTEQHHPWKLRHDTRMIECCNGGDVDHYVVTATLEWGGLGLGTGCG